LGLERVGADVLFGNVLLLISGVVVLALMMWQLKIADCTFGSLQETPMRSQSASVVTGVEMISGFTHEKHLNLMHDHCP
jgi:hypothetical protein